MLKIILNSLKKIFIANIKENQSKKVNFLIDSWRKQVYIQNEAFNVIDKKVIWVFLLISTSQIFLIQSYFFENGNIKFIDKNYLLYSLLLLWGIILIIILINFSWKKFEIWPWLDKQFKEFWKEEKSFFSLKLDTLKSLVNSVKHNNKIISIKSRNFRYIMYWIYIYYLFLITYLLINKIYV